MSIEMFDLAFLTCALGILISLTGAVTQVVKGVIEYRTSSNIISLVTALILTIGFGLGFMSYKAITVTPFSIFTLVVLGILVSLGSNIGYDKLLETLNFNKNKENLDNLKKSNK